MNILSRRCLSSSRHSPMSSLVGSARQLPLLVLLFSLIVSNHVSTALQCYFCYGTDESGDCSLPEDKFGNRIAESTGSMKIISCLPSAKYCYRLHYYFNGKRVTGRGCGSETFCDDQQKPPKERIVQEYDTIAQCDLCSSNLCNSTPHLFRGGGWGGTMIIKLICGVLIVLKTRRMRI